MANINILGMRLDLVQIPDVVNAMRQWISSKSYGNYVVISNANDAVISKNDDTIKEAVNASGLTVADGFSLVLAARLHGYRLKKRVDGTGLMLEFLRAAQEAGYYNFFYGSTLQTLSSLIKNLKEKFPNLKISGTYSPPFAENVDIDNNGIELINRTSPDVLWVSLGCPKQQLWMYKHRNKIKVPVIVGVGAAFDFLAGNKRRAPPLLREHGLEWLFRLILEPKRLWRRYLVNGGLFVYYVIKELWYNNLILRQRRV